MGYPSVKAKAHFVLLTMLLGSILGVFNSSYRGGFFAYSDPSSYERADGGATQELAGGMLVLCQGSLEYTRSVLKGLEGEDSRYLTSAWKNLAKAEEQFHVAQIQIFEYLDYHASVQHSRRVLELCEEAVDLASRIGVDYSNVLESGASDYDLAWGAIERAYTLLNNLEDAMSKLSDLDVTVVESVLDDARGYVELAETQLNDGDLDAADGSVNKAMSLLGQAMDLLQYMSRDKKVDKVLTLIESHEEQLRKLEGEVVDALEVTEDSEESLNYVANVFQVARDRIQQVKNQLEDGDLNLIVDELDTIFEDVMESLSSIGWLNDSDMQPLQFQHEPEETDALLEDDTEPLDDEGSGTSELEEELEEEPKNEGKSNNGKSKPKNQGKSNNGNSQNEEEPVVEESAPEPEPEPKEEPTPEEKSNNGNPQNDKDPKVKDETEEEPEPEPEVEDDDDDEDNSEIDDLVDQIEGWYERKKDKKDKKDKDD